MSFDLSKKVIEEGDTAILYLSNTKIYAIEIETQMKNKKGDLMDNVLQFFPYGALRVKDIIGKKYGTKVHLSKGWGFILQPSPELWTLTLPHRTQIIYTPDISMIVMQLEIAPGSVVVESGTGSGSLSHAIIRSVRPHGHLHTFDFHEVRCNLAREEFKNHGLESYVTVRHQDVCELGFTEELNEKADAVFLDLPMPWKAIPHAIKTFKNSGGRICTFSPCIEQVQRSCQTLHDLGFIDIKTIEVLRTTYSIQTRNVNSLKLDYLKYPKSEENKVEDADVSSDQNIEEPKAKKAKKLQNAKKANDPSSEVKKVLTAVPLGTQPGHTGYLTFATWLPKWIKRQENEGQE